MTINTAFRWTEAIRRFVRGLLGRFGEEDILEVIALTLLAVGLGFPLGLVVTGALLLLITPIGTAVRLLIRGR